MRIIRTAAICFLLAVLCGALFASWLAPHSYATQSRDIPNAAPSWSFLLGTDELGRDRFSRLLYGSRVSLLLAPAAALLSTAIAAIAGGAAGYFGGFIERATMSGADLFLSLPWLFLLLTVRAALPLNVAPLGSVLITFALLGLLGWAPSARVVRVQVKTFLQSDFLLQARASGLTEKRVFLRHLLPNLKPILLAQFWISIPVFVLSEANLGLLGLGVAEPLPSWGNLLRELASYDAVRTQPWILTPVVLLIMAVSCFQLVLGRMEVNP